MAGDRGIRGVREAEFLEPDAARPLGAGVGRHDGEEAIHQHLLEVPPAQFRADRSTDQLRSAPADDDLLGRDARVLEQPFLCRARLVPERLQLPAVDPLPGRLEPLLQQPREREVHVVPAEQDVLANRHPLEREIAGLFGHGDEAEVGGSAAHVAHEDEIADAHALAPRVPLAFEPCVERGLRFFQQREPLEPRLDGRPAGQLARLLVERRRHGEDDVLVRERKAAVGRVPRASEMCQIGGRHLDGREFLDFRRGLPGKDGRGAIDAAVRQP